MCARIETMDRGTHVSSSRDVFVFGALELLDALWGLKGDLVLCLDGAGGDAGLGHGHLGDGGLVCGASCADHDGLTCRVEKQETVGNVGAMLVASARGRFR